ncbi:stalk domain-containing protein [Acetivibrio mesophilus]|jgi:spore germination cell wall hydrolase CwlJ-like protein|uniref:Copper amine oxidase n=1 Tax=Acetivibrio mesophilus TaxID=2487273 RepID=A0A4Q0I6H0_9FIRM|nr:stalk domain-containing protein [Acetivibrio mesophilus]ODM25908.1 copper amine oxidase [Clostridium sp. Bc-iso-3]RXE59507.1 copper amine oxidase [Acetivibrio mesophilus]HHV29982.1 copper amine oxidase [Clostridium sp.]
MNSKGRCKVALVVLIVLLVSFIGCFEVSALTKETYITVKVNGNYIKMDNWPYIKDGRTFVSVRFIAEALGAKVEWNEEKKKVVIKDDYNYIELFIGSNESYINAVKQVMDASPEISNGRTMVPLRFVSETLDCSVDWNQTTYTVSINKEGIKVPEECVYKRSYTDDDLMWLARIVTVEARGMSLEGKVAVANVVLNRVKSPSFPNTVYDVIFQRGQFPPAYKSGFKELVPPDECIVAAKMALEGVNNIGTCLYFNNRPFTSRSGSFYKKIEGEYFYN